MSSGLEKSYASMPCKACADIVDTSSLRGHERIEANVMDLKGSEASCFYVQWQRPTMSGMGAASSAP